jgi:hypothetical protein
MRSFGALYPSATNTRPTYQHFLADHAGHYARKAPRAPLERFAGWPPFWIAKTAAYLWARTLPTFGWDQRSAAGSTIRSETGPRPSIDLQRKTGSVSELPLKSNPSVLQTAA